MTTPTDTPRTDAAFGQGKHGVMKLPYETSCKLERLATLWEADALRHHKNEVYWRERAEKAETKVERLKAAIKAWTTLD